MQRAGIKRPAWAGRRIEIINEAEKKPLDPRPRDHCRVVCTQRRRRCNKAQSSALREGSKALSQLVIGCDAPCRN
jgi:hypothetical protein